jgi:hypothetical protein
MSEYLSKGKTTWDKKVNDYKKGGQPMLDASTPVTMSLVLNYLTALKDD